MADTFLIRFTTRTGEPAIPTVLYTLDPRGMPFWSEWRRLGDGVMAVRCPKTQPFGIAALWEVSGFGQVIVTAGNHGEGFRLRDGQPSDFRLEAARSTVELACELAEESWAADVELASGTQMQLSDARSELRAADSAEGTRQAELAETALSAALWAAEGIALGRARAKLAAMPPERRKALRFGSPFFDTNVSDAFKEHFAQLLDFGTLPFYRGRVEPVEGELRWEPIDKALEWFGRHGSEAKGHPLSWLNEAGLPGWMRRLSFRTLKDVVSRQIHEAVTRYKDRIKIWDVINEAHDPLEANLPELSQEQRIELTEVACRAARDADPDAVRIVNCNRHWGYYRATWETRDPLHPIEYIERLAERGVDYEVLGLQMYHGGTGHWVRDMAAQSALMDQYAALGKPIHITEVQTPSSVEPEDPARKYKFHPDQAGWWHAPWCPETQADWVEQFYTIALGNSAVEAITWWSLSDSRTFWPHGGLLDRHDQPKPAYGRLRKLIDNVKTGRPPT